jgi:hypothetical protein
MKKILGAAVAATALVCAGSASAATLVSMSGTATNFWHSMTMPTTPGKYRIDLWASAPLAMVINVYHDYRWATYVVSSPSEGSPEGDEIEDHMTGDGTVSGTALSYSLVIPKTKITYFLSPDEIYHTEAWGIPPGTPMYRVDEYYNYRFQVEIYGWDMPEIEPPPFDYRFTLTAVPEPTTWAMMIIGFGLAGGALRRRNQLAVA